VGGEDHRGPAGVGQLKKLEHRQRVVAIEVAGGFVGQKDLGLTDQRPGHRHPLSFPHRERLGVDAFLVGEPHRAKHPGDAVGPLPPGNPPYPEDEGQVLLHRPPREETVVLEDHPHAPAV